MIGWSKINELQDKKQELQLKLNEALNDSNTSLDEVSAIKSEILYLDKQITRILGVNELRRLEEIKGKKNPVEQRNIKVYYALKDKYKKISKLSMAVKKMLVLIDSKMLEHELENNIDNLGKEKVKN